LREVSVLTAEQLESKWPRRKLASKTMEAAFFKNLYLSLWCLEDACLQSLPWNMC